MSTQTKAEQVKVLRSAWNYFKQTELFLKHLKLTATDEFLKELCQHQKMVEALLEKP